jgi:hypothetical protein
VLRLRVPVVLVRHRRGPGPLPVLPLPQRAVAPESEGAELNVTRPRIRTLKPEMWADEKIGALSRDARLLFVGLITMADDAGRFRALPSAILGHTFPYDEDAAKKLDRWMGEIESQGLVHRYTVGTFAYGVLPGWLKHQKINRATESTLPPPPSWNGHGEITEPSWSVQ